MIMDKKVPASESSSAGWIASGQGWTRTIRAGRSRLSSAGSTSIILQGRSRTALVLIPRDGEPVFWVRKSLERAQAESEFSDIRPMRSYRDAAAAYPHHYGQLHTETEVCTDCSVETVLQLFPGAECSSTRYICRNGTGSQEPF